MGFRGSRVRIPPSRYGKSLMYAELGIAPSEIIAGRVVCRKHIGSLWRDIVQRRDRISSHDNRARSAARRASARVYGRERVALVQDCVANPCLFRRHSAWILPWPSIRPPPCRNPGIVNRSSSMVDANPQEGQRAERSHENSDGNCARSTYSVRVHAGTASASRNGGERVAIVFDHALSARPFLRPRAAMLNSRANCRGATPLHRTTRSVSQTPITCLNKPSRTSTTS